VCFAGYPTEEKTDVAPMLVIVGENDPITDAKLAASQIEKACGSGVTIEFRLAAGQGHVLPVGRYLGDAIDWLLKRERGAGEIPEVPR
jgi:hypothetical protein